MHLLFKQKTYNYLFYCALLYAARIAKPPPVGKHENSPLETERSRSFEGGMFENTNKQTKTQIHIK
jgi:hypothetical protein